MADNFFCLDIAERHIKVADAKKTNNTLEVSTLGKIDAKEDFFSSELEKTVNDQANLINRLVGNLKISKKNVSIVIPDSLTYNQILIMPYLNEKELISAIKYQADQFIPMPIEETNIDLEIIEEYKEEKKILILIVAAPKKLIEKVQTTVELAGLIPESIENELSANSRFISEFYSKIFTPGKQNFLLVNVGPNSSTISFFEQEKPVLKESHNFSFGYELFLKEISINTDSDRLKSFEILKSYSPGQRSSYPIETIVAPLIREFITEIKRFIGTKRVSNVYFINYSAYFPGLISLIQKDLSLPASYINPLALTKKTANLQNYSLELPLYISTFGGNLR
ncbi:pilus assembly protein PilM [Patescibacteria group bacterium]|nr:pilus assembly protein PilM [Patescibacteria group bacterium]